MAAHTTDEFRIKSGQIVIYKRSDSSDNWHCRIKLPLKPYVRQSLKTTDKDHARELAEDLFAELQYKNRKGFAINSRKFASVARAYIKHLKEKNKLGLFTDKRLKGYGLIITKYFIPYLGKYDTDKITDMVFSQYRDWRRLYWLSGDGARREVMEYERNGKTVRAPKRVAAEPANSTISYEDSVLRQVFDFSRKNGYVTDQEIPDIKSPKVKSNRRPAFDVNQYRKLIRRSMWRYKQSNHPTVKHARLLLHDYILIMAGSGMRPQEAKTLKWSDISTFTAKGDNGIDRDFLKLSVRGKGKHRDFVPQPNVKIYFDRIKERQLQYAKENGYEVSESDFVFVSEKGQQIQSFKNGFDALLKSLDMLEDNHGQKYAPYCLRHTYATFRLIYGGVSVYELAQNMGTSVEMIEKHYGHLKPENVAARMTRGQNEH